MNTEKCIFCESTCTTKTASNRDAREYECEVCGRFLVSGLYFPALSKRTLTTTQKLHCISQNIKDNSDSAVPLWTFESKGEKLELPYILRNTQEYLNAPIQHANKPQELLKLMAEKLKGEGPFAFVRVNRKDAFVLKMGGETELYRWLGVIEKKGYIEDFGKVLQVESPVAIMQAGGLAKILKDAPFRITPEGWAYVESISSNIHSKKAFIAMSFGYSARALLQTAIEEACEATGWEAATIDKAEFNTGVMDEIKAKINEAAFVIAEFTEHNQGVYYEAGYGEGRNLPVIYLVNKEEMKTAHFDTRHLNHITWESPDDLKLRLINRIKGTINK